MQHTLLPLPERNALRGEYHVRISIVALFALSIAGSIGVASLFPAYMRGSLEEKLQLESIASLQKNKNASGIANIEQELATDKILLAALADGSDKMLTSAEIASLISARGTVRLSSLAMSRSADGATQIVVQGVAPTRESLLSFKNRIESQVPGTVVTLPISQLAKSTNIQFSMQIAKPKL